MKYSKPEGSVVGLAVELVQNQTCQTKGTQPYQDVIFCHGNGSPINGVPAPAYEADE